jgi:hypothetical protein
MTPMIDRSMLRARRSLAVAAFALLGSSTTARAQQPSDAPPPESRPAPAQSETVPAPAPATPPADLSRGEPAPATLAATAGGPPPSWYTRAPLTVGVGEGTQRWTVTFFGFVEADYISDTTRSYSDSIGSALVARNDTYQGTVGRTQFSMRNTRLGLAFSAPNMGSIR